MPVSDRRLWAILFFGLLIFYGLYYAPYGVNETDGSYLTGLAWHVLQGKVLYRDVVYVRMPLPVWTQALTVGLLPETGVILAERWLFYVNVALYSWLGAVLLEPPGVRRWQLAVLGFVVSAHCFQPSAWHTAHGILWGVLAFWAGRRGTAAGWFFGGVCVAAAVLCKQSFYPLLVGWPVWAALTGRWKALGWGLLGIAGTFAVFAGYMVYAGAWQNFIDITFGAMSREQARERGIFDYLRTPWQIVLLSAALLGPAFYGFLTGRRRRWAAVLWFGWLAALAATFVLQICLRQEWTAPFGQSRFLFLLTGAWTLWELWRRWPERPGPPQLMLLGLFLVTWCGAVSWGYALPILFATPWVYVVLELSRAFGRPFTEGHPGRSRWAPVAALLFLLVVFRIGYEWTYRDGRRGELTEPLGTVFPAMQGIYTDAQSVALYAELKQLAGRYGPNVTTLPIFTLSNFLTRTNPPLPCDWKVRREMGAGEPLVWQALERTRPVLLIEKAAADKIETDPELELVRRARARSRLLEETPNFWVMQYE
jgi:hypothetical protein